MTTLQSIPASASPEVPANDNFATLSANAIFGKRQPVTTGLTWGYYGGLFNGNTIADGTVTLTNAADNYVVVLRSTGVVSVSTSSTNSLDPLYAKLYKLTCAGSVVTVEVDQRKDANGLLFVSAGAGGIGDVVGPASAVSGQIASFSGTTGKLIQDSGLALDTDVTLAANSDTKVSSQKAVKTYVDAKVAGLSWKQAVRAATTTAGTLATSFENGDAIDGVTLATGDRILIKNQSSGSENGIYVVAASGAPARATDADSGAELVNSSVYVSEGTTLADTQWTCTTNATITVGSTSLAFAQLTSGGGSGTVTSVDASGGVETVSGSAITATGTIRAAHAVNAQTGTSYTYDTADRGKLVTHSNASAIAGTLPQAGTTGFETKWFMWVQNRGAGTLTITPTTSTIDGAATLALTTGQGCLVVSDGTNYFTMRGIGGASGGSTQGKHAIYIDAGSMRPSITSGCSNLTALQISAGQPDSVTLDFDPSSDEYAQFKWRMPKSWNEGTVTFSPVWSHAATTTNFGVAWALGAIAIGDGDALGTNYGTAQTSVDTGGTTNTEYIGPESSAITVAGSPAAGDMVYFRVYRSTADAGDTMAIDARLIGLHLYITTDADTDA